MPIPIPPIPLLPHQDDPKKDFTAEKEGFFPLKVTDICDRLASEEDLTPEGIASAFAQLRFTNWILENQASPLGKEASEVLRLVVLLQYLGHLEPHQISITSESELGWLGSLLEQCWGVGRKTLILWKVRGLGALWEGQTFSASHPENPFLPGAMFYPDTIPGESKRVPAWRQVRDALIAVHGREKLLNDEGEVNDPDLAASLSLYLGSFVSSGPRDAGWRIALEAWQNQLANRAAGGRPQIAAKLDISIQLISGDTNIDFGFYSGASSDKVWICPKKDCENSWVNDGDQQTIAAGEVEGNKKGQVFCSKHNQALRTGAGETVGPEHYGAYLAPDKKLYVWTDEKACPPGAIRVGIQGSSGSDGAVTYRFNKQDLVIMGHLVSLDTVRAKSIAWAAHKERGAPIPVDVPIRGEYATLIRSCKLEDLKGSWEIEFYGLRAPVSFQCLEPRETLWGRSAIVVWPPEAAPEWSVDYVAASTPQTKPVAFRLIEKDKDGCLIPSSPCLTDALYRTKKGRVNYVEIGEMIRDEFQSMGLLEVKRDSVYQENSGLLGQIVLDFGTSNSVVLWDTEGRKSPAYILSGEDPSKPSCFPTFHQDSFDSLLQSVNVLSCWDRKEKPPRPFLPSLHLKPESGKKGSEPCIPPRGRGLELLANPGGGEPRIMSGLKWKDWETPGVKDRVESLIQMLLLPAFWELRAAGCSSAELIATYPLAFGEDRRKNYEQILTKVTQELSRLTGFKAESWPITLRSESAAAINSLPRTNKTHVIALDVGGGTTDIAIHVGAVGGQASGQHFMTDLAADSIEYAGRDFLRAVVVAYDPKLLMDMLPKIDKDLRPPAPDKFGDATLAVDAYVDYLEALLHRNGVEGLDTLLKVERSKFDEAIMRWEALLSGLLFYIQRVVQGCISEVPQDKPVSVSFNLFGQGWELLRILSGNVRQPVISLLEPRFRALCENVGRVRGATVDASVQPIPELQERKKVVAEGAFKMQKEVSERRRAEAAFPSGSTEEKPTHAMGNDVRKTFVGMHIFNSQGEVSIEASKRLEEASPRPDWVGDPGYGRLLEELFNAIPEFIPGKTTQQLRSRIKGLLVNSNAYRGQFGVQDILKHLIDRGQNDLNRDTWRSGSMLPARSLLAGFLTSVWGPIWSGTKL